MSLPPQLRRKLGQELKKKKDHLYELDKLKFEKDEPAFKLKEKLRLEIIALEKELK